MIFLSTLLISMFITIALVPLLRSLAYRMNTALDMPDTRKVHCSPVPKVGGLAMAVGILVPAVFMLEGSRFGLGVLLGAGVIGLFGFLDDMLCFGYRGKFVGQVLGALIVVLLGGVKICYLGECLPGGWALPNLLAIPLTLIVIVGVTNAINLSDGLDGLAGGSMLLVFLCIGFLAFRGSHQDHSQMILILSAAASGAIIGFLRFNTFPATVFMGDTGSQLLGFLAITLSLGLTQSHTPVGPFVPLLLLGLPVLDTLAVMTERIRKGQSPFVADKNHLHHKLLRLGLYHTEAVVAIYATTSLLVASAFLLRFQSSWLHLSVYGLFCLLVVGGFTVADHHGWRVQRYDLIDKVIKGRLQVLREKSILIRVSFKGLEYGLPLLLVVSAAVPAEVPGYFLWVFLVPAVGIVLDLLFARKWLPGLMRLTFYLIVPVVLYLGQVEPAAWTNTHLLRAYNLAFVILALCAILTLKFTRRKVGFKATPMDVLILVIALVVPNLPAAKLETVNLALLSAKLIVLFFGMEVLLGELRGRWTLPTIAVVAALGILIVRAAGGI
jgi:UDP-GlcNAc:undecaprenyl-phosphate/decaprenyl-phosphate GlcNAc-1-phosphate transferase